MHLRTLAAGLTAATLLPFANASAAPQMLGLVATDGAVPFICAGTTCTAELTSFCLEEARDAPRAGRVYRLVPTRALALVVITATGSKRRVAAGPGLRFAVTRRGVAAVRATIDRARLKEMGAARLAIDVGAQVSLLPEARTGAGTPHSAGDIARVAGALRATGTALVDRAGPDIEAARLINRTINRLPALGKSAPEGRITAWRTARAASRSASPAGIARAKFIYKQCRQWTAATSTPLSLRECLEGRHIGLLSALNQRYWDATRPGM
ncbi:MAG TPA: hypothetical protein VM325_00800 [Alphaproteobacteria bacterium]|nr:hypothetical protein [Alphaproteobacteria bacterium]